MKTKRLNIFIGILLLVILIGCIPATPPVVAPAQESTEPTNNGYSVNINPAEKYNPQVNSADFTTNITNPYFSLPIGKKLIYEQKTKDGMERIEILVPGWTKTILGVETLVMWYRAYLDDVLIEDVRDYFAQHKNGDVWYFGEHVDVYENGKLMDHQGAWIAGVNGAKTGIWMVANPQVGDEFRVEYYKGEAEDIKKIVAVNETVTTLLGTYTGCVKTFDWAPLDKGTGNRYYCKEIGDSVLEVDLVGPETPAELRLMLVEFDKSGARDMTEVPSAYAREGVVGPSEQPTNDQITCKDSSSVTILMPTTYLYFEHNSTAGDTGIHGMFDSSTFAELCVYDPSGNQILAIKPQNQLGKLTMAGIFFESREPEHSETSLAEHLNNFPEGQYAVRGVTYDGIAYSGAATLTHNIPAPPKLIFPKEMADEKDIKNVIIAPKNVVIKWEPVTKTISGAPVTIVGYEVIVRRLTPANPHGFAHANYDVHVLPSATELAVPNSFWEPNTPYEFEVLALEASGNQTLTSGFFETGEKDSRKKAGAGFGKDDADGVDSDEREDSDGWPIAIISGLVGLAGGILLQKFALSKLGSRTS
jgi:hypothetical protein